MTPEDAKIGLVVLTLIAILVLSGFIVIGFYLIRNDSHRITWIENEFYKRENLRRTQKLAAQKDGE